MRIVASKEIWSEESPLPCIRISFLADFCQGELFVDWGKWVDFCDSAIRTWGVGLLSEYFKFSSLKTFEIDYEESCNQASYYLIERFISWLQFEK